MGEGSPDFGEAFPTLGEAFPNFGEVSPAGSGWGSARGDSRRAGGGPASVRRSLGAALRP